MQSDAKVPDPVPRGITVPAGAVIVLVLTGAIWGVGLFLLGRQTAPPVEVLDHAGASHLASLNRIDQALVRGDQQEIVTQMASAVLPDDQLGRTALELRRARVTELAVQQKAREAEEAATREAASTPAVMKRLQANLWQLYVKDPARSGETSHQPIRRVDVPLVETPEEERSAPATQAEVKPVSPSPAPLPSGKPLAELVLAGEPFIPDARITHPTIPGRAYALHPRQGLLRSDDGGKTWRVGLGPLPQMKGMMLSFTSGDRPLLQIWGGEHWVFADTEDAFFP